MRVLQREPEELERAEREDPPGRRGGEEDDGGRVGDLGELLDEQAAHRVADEDRATDRGGDAAGVRQVVVEGDAADVADGLRAVVAAQIQRVAGIPAPGEEAEPVVPHPAPAPHPVDEEQRPPPLRHPRRHALDLEPGDLHRHPARF